MMLATGGGGAETQRYSTATNGQKRSSTGLGMASSAQGYESARGQARAEEFSPPPSHHNQFQQ